uniref:Target of rapamycin complex 2 subunit MAPKAP1 n=2 Tax=Schistocephalus solidus TaxID=70667 RepID=A0A0X3NZI2_SCHSO
MFDTEDDLDADFPPLKPSDPMHKYEFDSLALVDRDINKSLTEDGSEPLVFVTVHLAQGISLLRFPVSATLQMVMDSAIKRRQLRQHVGYAYRLERWIEPTESHESSGIPLTSREPLDLTLRLSDCQEQDLPLRFVLIREHSRYDPAVDDSDDVELPSKSAAGAPDIPSLVLQSRKYRASQLRGLSTREVQLIVSPDRLDLQPSRRPKLFRGSKSLSIPMDNVLDCSTPLTSADTADQPLKKVRFSITYLPQPVGSVVASAEEVFGLEQTVDLHFEAQWTSARAICQHLNLIFACYASSLRKAYARLRSSLS